MLAGFAQSIYHVQISHSRKASIDITIAGTVSPDSSHWNDQVSRGKAGPEPVEAEEESDADVVSVDIDAVIAAEAENSEK